MAPCYVAIEEAMRARQTRPGAHDRDAQATEEFFCDREFSVGTDLDKLGRFSVATE